MHTYVKDPCTPMHCVTPMQTYALCTLNPCKPLLIAVHNTYGKKHDITQDRTRRNTRHYKGPPKKCGYSSPVCKVQIRSDPAIANIGCHLRMPLARKAFPCQSLQFAADVPCLQLKIPTCSRPLLPPWLAFASLFRRYCQPDLL
jgi:hypothetical protein